MLYPAELRAHPRGNGLIGSREVRRRPAATPAAETGVRQHPNIRTAAAELPPIVGTGRAIAGISTPAPDHFHAPAGLPPRHGAKAQPFAGVTSSPLMARSIASISA